MLYSLSAAIHEQVKSYAKKNYAHEMRQGQNLAYTYLAGKLIQQPFDAVLDEDVRDGSVASDRKVVVVTSVDYLDPKVVHGLEEFITAGGKVLLTGDCTVAIKGAKNLGVTPGHPDQALIDKLQAELKTEKDKTAIERRLGATQRTGRYLAGAMPLAKAIKAELAAAKIAPIVETDVSTMVATRHVAGDVEYIFLVNATPDDDAADAKGNPERVTPKAVEARITLPDDGRPTYDAVLGGNVLEYKEPGKGGTVSGKFRFGPGEMRVFARTARPIGPFGGIKLARPVVTRDLVLEKAPVEVKIAATVVDEKGDILTGSMPLHVLVIDPLGVARQEVFRATEQGQLALRLPLAANDPAGRWTVAVVNLLAPPSGAGIAGAITSFDYLPPAQARAIAGATRALSRSATIATRSSASRARSTRRLSSRARARSTTRRPSGWPRSSSRGASSVRS